MSDQHRAAWGNAREDAVWWPGAISTNDQSNLHHQQIINQHHQQNHMQQQQQIHQVVVQQQPQVLTSTSSAPGSQQLFSYKMASGFPATSVATVSTSNPSYDYRLAMGQGMGTTPGTTQWWYATAGQNTLENLQQQQQQQLNQQSQQQQQISQQQTQQQQSQHQNLHNVHSTPNSVSLFPLSLSLSLFFPKKKQKLFRRIRVFFLEKFRLSLSHKFFLQLRARKTRLVRVKNTHFFPASSYSSPHPRMSAHLCASLQNRNWTWTRSLSFSCLWCCLVAGAHITNIITQPAKERFLILFETTCSATRRWGVFLYNNYIVFGWELSSVCLSFPTKKHISFTSHFPI